MHGSIARLSLTLLLGLSAVACNTVTHRTIYGAPDAGEINLHEPGDAGTLSEPLTNTDGGETEQDAGVDENAAAPAERDAGPPPVIRTDGPQCLNIGTPDEGWYDKEGNLICNSLCFGEESKCNYIGSRSEGWYASGGTGCLNDLIRWETCTVSTTAP